MRITCARIIKVGLGIIEENFQNGTFVCVRIVSRTSKTRTDTVTSHTRRDVQANRSHVNSKVCSMTCASFYVFPKCINPLLFYTNLYLTRIGTSLSLVRERSRDPNTKLICHCFSHFYPNKQKLLLAQLKFYEVLRRFRKYKF